MVVALRPGPVCAQEAADPDSPDFVKATLLLAAPGEAIYQISGHSMLLMECPSAGLRYIFSFESESADGVFSQLFHESYGKVMAVAPEEYLQQFKEEGRQVVALPLNLTPAQKRELWRALDERLVQEGEKFNIRTRHCTSMLIEAINQAVAPSYVEVVGSKVIGGPDMGVVDAGTPEDAPWRNLVIRMAMGSVCDRAGTLGSQSLPMVVAHEWRHFRIVSPEGESVPLFASGPQVVLPGRSQPRAPLVTPLAVSLVILLVCVVAAVMRVLRRGRVFVICVDAAMPTLLAAVGGVLIFAVCSPAHIGGWANWNFVLFNPLPLLAWLLWRRRPWFGKAEMAYAGAMLVFAVAMPFVTLSVTMPIALVALSAALCAGAGGWERRRGR